MYVLTMHLSMIRDGTGVMDIGRYCEGRAGYGILGMGVMIACFHCCGTVDVASDWLNSWAMGAANAGAPRRKNHAGSPSRHVAVISILTVSVSIACE